MYLKNIWHYLEFGYIFVQMFPTNRPKFYFGQFLDRLSPTLFLLGCFIFQTKYDLKLSKQCLRILFCTLFENKYGHILDTFWQQVRFYQIYVKKMGDYLAHLGVKQFFGQRSLLFLETFWYLNGFCTLFENELGHNLDTQHPACKCHACRFIPIASSKSAMDGMD